MAWATLDSHSNVLEVGFSAPLLDGTDHTAIEIADDRAIMVMDGKLNLQHALSGPPPAATMAQVEISRTLGNSTYPTMMHQWDIDALSSLSKLIPVDAIAVEIGSRLGGSAKIMLDNAPRIQRLYCIDIDWAHGSTCASDKNLAWIAETHGIDPDTKIYDYAKQLLSGYSAARLLPMSSPYDLSWWSESVDFIFEDSLHSNPQLQDSLEFWVPLVKSGGIIAGHDYVQTWPDVVQEVDALAARLNATLQVQGSVWWMIKPATPLVSCVTVSEHSLSRRSWNNLLNETSRDLLHGKHLFIWDWRHAVPREICQAFPWAEFEDCRVRHADRDIAVIIDSNLECPDYATHLKPLCDVLIDRGIKPRNILLWGNSQESSDIPVSWIYSRGGWSIGMWMHEPIVDSLTVYHFVMLARQPRPLRLLMACEILRRGLGTYGNLSCGAQSDHKFTDSAAWHAQFIDPDLAEQFPLLLDGAIHQQSAQQYQTTDTRIRQACINVICESSQDSGLDDSIWIKPWVTEKTTKALLLCQIPLMVAVPGSVANLRDQGIDVFDDVIDHGYDLELDPRRRIKLVADQLERLCLAYEPSELRSSCWTRLLRNREIALDMLQQEFQYQLQQLSGWLRNIQ